jgi:hypothetical protein
MLKTLKAIIIVLLLSVLNQNGFSQWAIKGEPPKCQRPCCNEWDTGNIVYYCTYKKNSCRIECICCCDFDEEPQPIVQTLGFHREELWGCYLR